MSGGVLGVLEERAEGLVFSQEKEGIEMQATFLRSVGLALLVIGLAACAGQNLDSSMDIDFSKYAHQVADGKVAIYWNCSRPTPGTVQVQGVANSPWFTDPIQDLQFWVYGVNSQDGNVSRAHGSTRDFLIQLNAPSPFDLTLQATGQEVRFDMIYDYTMGGGGGRRGAGVLGEQRNMARNICQGLAP